MEVPCVCCAVPPSLKLGLHFAIVQRASHLQGIELGVSASVTHDTTYIISSVLIVGRTKCIGCLVERAHFCLEELGETLQGRTSELGPTEWRLDEGVKMESLGAGEHSR
jgi:hypothetical protein